MKANILVTGSGSLYGVAIVRSLRQSTLPCRVVACDTEPMTLGLYLADSGYLIPPAKEEQAWLDKIMHICRLEQIHGIFTGSSHEVIPLATHKKTIRDETGAKVFINSLSVIDWCLDKWQTVKFLHQNGFYYPQTLRWPEDAGQLIEYLQQVSFPVVAKPRHGAGSQGLAVLNEYQRLLDFLDGKGHYLVQQHIPGDAGEFTVGVCLGTGGKVLSSIALKRTLREGMTMAALAGNYQDICDYCERVAVTLGAYGPLNIQLRLKDGQPYIFEINPRFSSSTGMRIALGVNEPELLVKSEIFGQQVSKPTVKNRAIIRQYSDYVITHEQLAKVRPV